MCRSNLVETEGGAQVHNPVKDHVCAATLLTLRLDGFAY
jgi:hypothetical protein